MAKDSELFNEDGTLNEDVANTLIDDTIGEDDEKTSADGEENETNETSTDDDDAGGDDSDSVEPDEDHEPGDSDEEWASSDDIREIVESLQLPESVLKEFGSRDEFERALRVMDHQFARSGQQFSRQRQVPGQQQDAALQAQQQAQQRLQQQQQAQQRQRDAQGRFIQQQQPPQAPPQLDPDYYDPEVVTAFNQQNEYYHNRLSQLEQKLQQMEQFTLQSQQQQAQKQQEQMVSQFDSMVDQLGYDDLFGKSDDLGRGTSEWKNRERLWTAMGELWAGMAASGRQVQMTPTLVRRAANLAFGDELLKREKKNLLSQARKQSRKRLGVGRLKSPIDKPYSGPPEKDPVLHEEFRRLEAENG